MRRTQRAAVLRTVTPVRSKGTENPYGYVVEHDPVVREAVHGCLVGAPVVVVAPVVDQLFEPGPVGPVAPVLVAGIERPADPGQTLIEVFKHPILNGNGEPLGHRGHQEASTSWRDSATFFRSENGARVIVSRP
jgi:hypothetical protein